MTRNKAREKLMSIIFQMDARDDLNRDSVDYYLENVSFGNQYDYATALLEKICSNIEEIDSAISKNSTKWKISRIPKTDLAILRLATAEILFDDDIPNSAAINEAVNLAKIYCDDNSPSYINGILGSIVSAKPNN